MKRLWTRPTWYEIAGVTALAVWAVTLADEADHSALAAALGIASASSLLLRRSVPLLPLAVTLTCLLTSATLAGYPGPDDPYLLALVWASYSAGRHAPPRSQPWPAFMVLLFVALTSPGAQAPGDIVFPFMFAGVPWLAGLALQLATNRAQRAESKADDLASQMLTVAGRAEVDERLRIARELHDVMGHTLTGLSLQAQALRRRVAAGKPLAEADVRTIETTTNELLTDVRRLVGLLHSDSDDERRPLPGIGDLETLVGQSVRHGQQVELIVRGEPRPLPPALSSSLFRICQEALSNAGRHGGGGTVWVEVTWASDSVLLEVRNDLRVAVPDDASLAWPGGHGLPGMRERAELHGGRFRVTQDERTWKIDVVMPTPALQALT